MIDRPTFDELRISVGDEFAAELVGAFLEDAPVMLAQLRASLGAGDADGYRRAAHSLKANGKTFGAMEFASMAEATERSGFTGDPATDVPVVDALAAAYATAAAELAALLPSSDPNRDRG
ncbi:MAG TPA: Hpt domain-containing protein [Ilumatobacteraceae bacterium]